jgi:hypothetical protein
MIGRRLARAPATRGHRHQRVLTVVGELVAIEATAPERDDAARVGSPEDVAGRVPQTSDRAPLEI